MSLERPSSRRTVPVTLTQIPWNVRLSALVTARAMCRSEEEIADVMLAAVAPSDTVYWLAETARDQVEEWGA
jgi:hypothetical protein